MSLFKSLFRGAGSNQPRTLEHPRDLQLGDMVKFGFADQQIISNQRLEVEAVNTCDLGGEARKKIVFTLRGVGPSCRCAVVETSCGDVIELGRAVLPDDVEQVFDIEAFMDLLDPDTGINHVLERQGEPEDLAGWTGTVYRQEAGHNAYLYSGDYRSRPMPEDAEAGDAFSYYLLVTDDRRHGLEVQVYDGGRTEVYLLAYLGLAKIEALWPAAGAA